MRIKRITVQGFKSFNYPQVFDFDRLNPGIYFVSGVNEVEQELGANGSGKSTLFVDALCWCLFGKTPNNLKADNIRSWIGELPTKVDLEFDNYTLTRTWSPNSLVLNNKTISQDELNRLIKLNFESFLYSVVISQFGEKFIDFIPSEKLRIFTSILEDLLECWDNYSDIARQKKDEEDNAVSILTNKIFSLEGELNSLNIELLEKKETEFEKERELKIKELQKQLATIKLPKEQDFDKLLEMLENALEEIDESIREKESSVKENYKELLEVRENIMGIKTEISQLNELLEKFSELLPLEKCPVCGNALSKDHIEMEISSLQKKKDEKLSLLLKAEERGDYIEGLIDKYNKELSELKSKKSEYFKKKEQKTVEKTKYAEEIINKKNLQEMLRKQIQELSIKENPYTSLLVKALRRNEEIKQELVNLNKDKELLVKRSNAFKFWTKGFKDIKLMLISDSLKEFEVQINNNLEKLGLGDWKVQLKIDAETKSGSVKRGFNVLVKSPINDSPVPFECWSGGEGQRIRLATTIGLIDFIKYRRGSFCNILVFDEPTQFLSEKGIEDLIIVLKEKAYSDGLKLFLIDHRNLKTFGEFDGIINVVKTEKGSKIIL